jgi:predicted metal-dependent hydrolase
MSTQLELGDITVDVDLKDIKNIHLSVLPPAGRVRISAPARMSLDAIRVFAISKLSWIKSQRAKLQAQPRETPREYLERESHYVWGKRHLLEIIVCNQGPSIELAHGRMCLKVRPGTTSSRKQEIVEAWYRAQLQQAVCLMVAKWEPIMGVKIKDVYIQKMKTKWGSCNTNQQNIRLNTELAKKPRECLEYIVAHEMTHLLVRSHNEQFIALMDKWLPNWRTLRRVLNDAPLSHADWAY